VKCVPDLLHKGISGIINHQVGFVEIVNFQVEMIKRVPAKYMDILELQGA
jgi:hypothetical protein